MMDARTIDCYRGRIATVSARRADHPLNDQAVKLREGSTAVSVYARGTNYTPRSTSLIVLGVIDGRALVAGPMGPATVNVADLIATGEMPHA